MAQRFPDQPAIQGLLIAAVAALSVFRATDFRAPPRYDGAGYSVLAIGLGTGQGYREVDRPGAPRHAHFPPGYPAALALLWAVTGRSAAAAHALSAACTVAAAVAAWAWFRSFEPPRAAFLAGLAVALNWAWARNGGGIQSEPLFLLLGQLALLAAGWVGRGGGLGPAAGLGALLGAAVLTRHVGLALAAAVLIDLTWRGRRREALVAGAVAFALILPWAGWVAAVRTHTQAGLLLEGNLAERVLALAAFYVRRIPDQMTGPFVETATVFRKSPGLALAMNVWAVTATALVLAGWARSLRRPDRRLVGLVGGCTLALLLVWPFTEAGRFLVPLVPVLVAGAVGGLAGTFGGKAGRGWVAAAVLGASAPYAAYALAADRARAQRGTHADFDAACAWIAAEGKAPGPVLSRHPGEVFWQTGRQGLDASTEDVAGLIDRAGVAYLLIDAGRYADAPGGPLDAFVKAAPGRVRLAWSRGRPGGPTVSVYEVRPVTAPGR